MTLQHIPKAVVATVLLHARSMRNMRGNQQPDQWRDARYRAAADLAQDLRDLHGIHADQWARDLIFKTAN